MSECDLKIEINQMIKNSNYVDVRAIGSIVKALQMRHSNLDACFASRIVKIAIEETQCVISKYL